MPVPGGSKKHDGLAEYNKLHGGAVDQTGMAAKAVG